MRRINRSAPMSEITPTLTWDVEEHVVISNGRPAGNYKALHRNDNGGLLNIVKSSYNTATNKSFMEIVEKIRVVTDFELTGYSVAGDGGRVLAYLKNRSGMDIGDFTTENYMVLGNSFDYSTGFFGGNVNNVLRCQNEFGKISQDFRIRHNGIMEARLTDMVRYYENYILEQTQMKQEFETWQGITMSKDVKDMFIDEVLAVKKDENNEVSTVKKNQVSDLWVSVNREINDMGDNLWSLFNGVTHYTTHVRGGRERVFGNILGGLADINARAFQVGRKIAAGDNLVLA